MTPTAHKFMTAETFIECIASCDSLSEAKRRKIINATKSICAWGKYETNELAVHPVSIRRYCESISPGQCGITKKTISNAKSQIKQGLKHVGGLREPKLEPAWQAVYDLSPDEFHRAAVSRLLKFLSLKGKVPNAIGEEIAQEFYKWNSNFSMRRDPNGACRRAIKAWNWHVDNVSGWPQQHLAAIDMRDVYALGWDQMHPALGPSVEGWLHRETTDDPFDLSRAFKKLARSTVDTYNDRVRRYASCLIASGVDVNELRCLDDLISVAHATRGLGYLAYRADPPRLKLAGTIAKLLAQIAKHELSRPDDEVDQLNELARRLKSKSGLSTKTRDRLTPLKEEDNLAKLFLLPFAIARKLARKSSPTRRDAVLLRKAVMMIILAYCPMRRGNLAALRLDKHFKWSAEPFSGRLTLEFEDEELKNNKIISMPVPDDAIGVIKIYVERFRPLLFDIDSPFLFPSGDPSKPILATTISRDISRLVFERLGWPVYPHLYRHCVHLVVLKRFPGAFAMVSRVLGHNSLLTARTNYSCFADELAMKSFQELVFNVKDGTSVTKAARIDDIVSSFDEEDLKDD